MIVKTGTRCLWISCWEFFELINYAPFKKPQDSDQQQIKVTCTLGKENSKNSIKATVYFYQQVQSIFACSLLLIHCLRKQNRVGNFLWSTKEQQSDFVTSKRSSPKFCKGKKISDKNTP